MFIHFFLVFVNLLQKLFHSLLSFFNVHLPNFFTLAQVLASKHSHFFFLVINTLAYHPIENVIQNWGEAKKDQPPCLMFEGVASASPSTVNISERPVFITGVLNNGFDGDLEPGVGLSVERLSLTMGAGIEI